MQCVKNLISFNFYLNIKPKKMLPLISQNNFNQEIKIFITIINFLIYFIDIIYPLNSVCENWLF